MSGSSWVRRAFSMGVRSPPPPNHHLLVTTKRVFMWAVGTCGLCGWTMSDTPEAQNRGSSSAPGICLRNSGANSPWTVEVWTPAFSNTRPCSRLATPPPPSAPRLHGVRTKRAGARRRGRPAARPPAAPPRCAPRRRTARRAAPRTSAGPAPCEPRESLLWSSRPRTNRRYLGSRAGNEAGAPQPAVVCAAAQTKCPAGVHHDRSQRHQRPLTAPAHSTRPAADRFSGSYGDQRRAPFPSLP